VALRASCAIALTVALCSRAAELESHTYFIEWYIGDDQALRDLYWRYYSASRDLFARGLAKPLSAIKPSPQDPEGNWGSAADGLQLSVRLNRSEFARGEPVPVMLLLRNLNSTGREVQVNHSAHENFDYTVHFGTNELRRTWVNPEANPPPPFYWSRESSHGETLSGHTQAAFLTQLDRTFDLSHVGEYSVQANRIERLPGRQGKTNIVSGMARFRVVETLSQPEVARTNAFAGSLREMLETLASVRTKEAGQYLLSYGRTNAPPK
jgi:hypothetical protein